MNTSGKISSYSRENGGYRVQLDRGRESYWIPESHMRNRGNSLRDGILLLRDSSTRETIEVDMRDTRRSSRIDLGDLRRGDSVTLQPMAPRRSNLRDRLECCGRSHSLCMFEHRGIIKRLWLREGVSKPVASLLE